MKRHIYTITAIAIVFSLLSCGNKNQGQAANGRRSQATPVVAVKIPTRDFTTYKSYPTTIEGIINSEARPKISGYITKVLVDEGQKVHQGQLLFKLETHSLSEQAAAAKASVHTAQVKVDQLKPLVKKDIVSQSQLATAKAQLQQAKSNYQSILANIGYAEVRSPVNGYVGAIRIRKGNLVSPSDPKPLTTVSKIDKVYAYFSMNEKDYLNFMAQAKGKTKEEKIANMPKVTLVMPNGQAYKHKGTIQTINSQVDPTTGTISFRAIFDNPAHILTNGSTGTIKMPKTYTQMLAVPQQSTFELQDKTLVMKVAKKGDSTIAEAQVIKVKDKVRGVYIVTGGIKKGQEIVAKGAGALPNGSLIKPKLMPYDSIAKPLHPVFIK